MLQSLAAAGPAMAQQAVADPYEQLLDTIEASMSEELILQSSVRALETRLRLDPTIATLERQRPGVVQLMSEAARPTLASYTRRVRADYRPRFVAVLRKRLTAEEVLEIAGFFESPIGRKLLAATASNYDGRAAGSAAAQGEAITSTQIREDASAATGAALASLDEADQAEIAREAGSRPALLKLGPVRAEFNEIRALMEGAPMSAAEQASLTAAIQAALRAR